MPAAEQQRLKALDQYDILDTPAEEPFDRVTRLGCRIFSAPISTITFVDGHRQWFKSRQGLAATEGGQSGGFCTAIVRSGSDLVVDDATADPEFRHSPYVTGEPHIRFYAGVPLRSPDGEVVGTFCVMDTEPRSIGEEDRRTLHDLARLTTDMMEMRRQAHTDALTGLQSRRAFRAEAERVLTLAVRHRHAASGLILDLDNFKGVNDRFGHAIGDAVLKAAATAVARELRSSDVAGRFGGEEFVVLLPLTGRSGALEAAERLRKAVALIAVPAGDETVTITTSIGVAVLEPGTDDIDALLAHADSALYDAKRGGRDRCEIWTAPAAIAPTVRRRVLKAGRIAFNAGRSSIDCTVRALSSDAARIEVISTGGIPETFKLQIDADGFSRLCRIIEKGERHVEVAFEAAAA